MARTAGFNKIPGAKIHFIISASHDPTKPNSFLFFAKERHQQKTTREAAFEIFTDADPSIASSLFANFQPKGLLPRQQKPDPNSDTPQFGEKLSPVKRLRREFPSRLTQDKADIRSREKENMPAFVPALDASRSLNIRRTGVSVPVPPEKRPSPPAPPVTEGLLGTDHVEERMRTVFPFSRFNQIQSQCFDLVYESDENAVITAPTGSGKTAMFELAICRLYSSGTAGNRDSGQSPPRSLYIAPMKALCQERFEDWKARFGRIGLKVSELTGDTEDPFSGGELTRAQIILTTPEKWDTFTRKWKDNKSLVQGIRLMMIDEVHLLGTERGSTLEAIVARMQSISNLGRSGRIRIIAQSATIPNMEDLSEWLNVNPKVGLRRFGEEFRPIKLQKFVLGYPPAKNEYTFECALNFRLAGVIKKYSDRRPSLVFCQTQKGTVAAANRLKEDIETSYLIDTPQQQQTLVSAAAQVREKALQSYVSSLIS